MDESLFHVPAARGFRALTVGIDDSTVSGSFLSKIPAWFREIAEGEKISWEEAMGTANVIPDSVSTLSIRKFIAFFGNRAFSVDAPNRQLGTSRLPLLPKELIAEEFSARKMLLDNLNLTIALEAILLQTGENASDASAHAAALKMSLLPLWNTFEVFAAKRLQLRKKALVGCFPENPHVRNLVSSSPFSAGLFSSNAIQELNRQALHQAKPILVLLEFKAPSKRSYADLVARVNKHGRSRAYVRSFSFPRDSQ